MSTGRGSSLAACRDAVRSEAELLRFEATVFLPWALDAAARPLVEAGLEPVIFKGPALSMRYPEPGLRPMGDIDSILPVADHDKAVGTLVGLGWKVVRASDHLHYDAVLAHGEIPGLGLELHHDDCRPRFGVERRRLERGHGLDAVRVRAERTRCQTVLAVGLLQAARIGWNRPRT
ncbi:MAG TPA: nucleotidyltransferase family protein [Acidimicrobiales bacterium]